MARWPCAMANGICRWRSAPWRTSRRRLPLLTSRPKGHERAGEAATGKEFRSEERTKSVASSAGVRRPATSGHRMSSILGEWREGKVRPVPGNAPHDQPASRGIISSKSICDDPFPATRFPQLGKLLELSVGVFKAYRNLSGPMGFKTKTKLWLGSLPPPPSVGPEPKSKNAPGGSRSFSSSADEFRPAIPRSGCSPAEPVSASPAS